MSAAVTGGCTDAPDDAGSPCRDVTFWSSGVNCSAWHFPAAGPETGGGAGRAVVVMAHGVGGTKDSGLRPFAERFAAAGMDVLAFDYRGFGTSEGEPRQVVSIDAQLADYRAAIAAARALPGVRPDRVVLWGSSLSGGHVLRVAADRDDVAAVIAMTPLTDALATGRAVVRQYRAAPMLRSAFAGAASRLGGSVGRDPIYMPLVAYPGQPGALALDGAYDSYLSLAGPTWRNEVDSSVGMELLKIRTKSYARRLRSPLLVQIADFDRFVPADAVLRTAVAGRAQVHHYPCDHFDVWPEHDWFERAAADQVSFLKRVLRQPESG
ncbi:alpha/beta hydrolase [Mycolicibacterium palauense]|uniref:alpha/beta hydrolase n=1 Tax=Mycolicibacterium palauense TaxID=2034511 RepID=UPI000BFF0D1D|nr:alpha/beta hydrolase [Mycolicibacterium palauense]